MPNVAHAHKTFDLKTHTTDALTGKVTLTNPYRLRIIGASKYFERPVGSGNLWTEADEPCGRWIAGKVDADAAHTEWIAPTTGTEKIQLELKSARETEAALRAELDAIKAEHEKAVIAKAQATISTKKEAVPEKAKA